MNAIRISGDDHAANEARKAPSDIHAARTAISEKRRDGGPDVGQWAHAEREPQHLAGALELPAFREIVSMHEAIFADKAFHEFAALAKKRRARVLSRRTEMLVDDLICILPQAFHVL